MHLFKTNLLEHLKEMRNNTLRIVTASVLAGLLTTGIIQGGFDYAERTKSPTSTYTVGQGLVTGKFESDYACGSKGRYTCYSRYLELNNNQKVEVNFDTFKSMQIGDNAFLTVTEDKKQSFYEFLMFAFIIVIILTFIVLSTQWLFWALFKSHKTTFISWFKASW